MLKNEQKLDHLVKLTNGNVDELYVDGPFHLLKYRYDPVEKKATGNLIFDKAQTYRYQLECEIPDEIQNIYTEETIPGELIVRPINIQWQYGKINEPNSEETAFGGWGKYSGEGTLVCHPTKEHIIIEPIRTFKEESVMIPSELFIACDARYMTAQATTSYNHQTIELIPKDEVGIDADENGAFVLFSAVAETELIKLFIEDGKELKIDDTGPYPILWTSGVKVQRSNATTVFSGRGELWLSPVARPKL